MTSAPQLLKRHWRMVFVAIATASLLRGCVFSVLYFPEKNMEPGLQVGDFVLGSKLAYGWPIPLMKGKRLWSKSPEVGDIVSFFFPGDPNQILVRRVVAVAGDTFEIREGRLVRNGVEAFYGQDSLDGVWQESWSRESPAYRILGNRQVTRQAMTVPPGHFFTLADNRNSGDDSLSWGSVPYENLHSRLGRVWLSIETQADGLQLRWDRMFSKVE